MKHDVYICDKQGIMLKWLYNFFYGHVSGKSCQHNKAFINRIMWKSLLRSA